MQSHLGGDEDGNIYQINANTPEFRDGIPVSTPPPRRAEVDAAYCNPADMPLNRPGHVTQTIAATSDFRHIEGSNTQLHNADPNLPVNDMHGSKFVGTTKIVSAAELDAMDRQHGTSVQPLRPGVYQLQDGNILLVFEDGRREVVTPQEYRSRVATQQHQAQAPQPQQPQGLVGRLLGRLRGG